MYHSGLGQLEDIVLPAPNYGAAYYDPSGQIIVPGSSGGWSVMSSSGALNPGSGPAPLNASGEISSGVQVLGSPLSQSSTGNFGAPQTTGLSNVVLIGAGILGVVVLMAMFGGRRR